MPSLTVENYAKAIYGICVEQDGGSAATGQIAEALGVSPGSVTSMLKTLKDAGLAEYKPYEGVRLTSAGRMLALRVLRRHRLIELFLSKTLALTWDEVHEEAENMEHAVSDLLVDRIDQHLGYPERDPHGDPIPRADGTLPPPANCTLADCQAGDAFRLVRVLDQTPDFLRYLTENELSLGVSGTVSTHQAAARVVTVRVNFRETSLALEMAQKLLVSLASETE